MPTVNIAVRYTLRFADSAGRSFSAADITNYEESLQQHLLTYYPGATVYVWQTTTDSITVHTKPSNPGLSIRIRDNVADLIVEHWTSWLDEHILD